MNMTSGKNEFTVRKATISDLEGIKRLADAHKSELGFIVRSALQRSIESEELLVAEADSELLGFIQYRHRKDEQTTLYNVAVAPQRRGNGVGRALVLALATEAQKKAKQLILLKCPTELRANAFYQRYGFELAATETGKHRALNIWKLPLD
jgi:N-acetylglutamate synthase-like GNAT family acetyltransferase